MTGPGTQTYPNAPPFLAPPSWGRFALAAGFFAALSGTLGFITPMFDELYVDLSVSDLTTAVLVASRVFRAVWPIWVALMAAASWRARRMSEVLDAGLVLGGLVLGGLVLYALFEPLLHMHGGIGRNK